VGETSARDAKFFWRLTNAIKSILKICQHQKQNNELFNRLHFEQNQAHNQNQQMGDVNTRKLKFIDEPIETKPLQHNNFKQVESIDDISDKNKKHERIIKSHPKTLANLQTNQQQQDEPNYSKDRQQWTHELDQHHHHDSWYNDTKDYLFYLFNVLLN